MRRIAHLAALSAGIVFLSGHAPSARAQEVRCVRVAGGVLECVVVAPAPAPDALRDLSGVAGPPLVWSRTRINDNPGAPPSCDAREVGTPAGPVIEFGTPWLIMIRNTETSEYVLVRLECQYSGESPPEPPPPVPDLADIAVDRNTVFSLETGLNPPQNRRGVSQLPTWLWCSNAGPVDVEATVLPHRASARAAVALVKWTIDGPDGRVDRVADDCGSEPDVESDGSDAAATWTPNEAGVSTITLSTEWSALWTYTYFDPTFGAVDLGTFDLGTIEVTSEPILYEVYEIQSVGVGP